MAVRASRALPPVWYGEVYKKIRFCASIATNKSHTKHVVHEADTYYTKDS